MEPSTSRTSKGQLSSFDLIVSMMLFLAVILMTMWAVSETQTHIWGFEDTQTYKDKALDAIDLLLKTGGDPWYWEEFNNLSEVNISSIGLVSEPGILEWDKLDRFDELPYNQSRRLLGFSKEDYSIEIINHRNLSIYEFGATGEPVIALERSAILQNMTVTFKLKVFKQ